MQTREISEDGLHILVIEGEIDLARSPELREVLHAHPLTVARAVLFRDPTVTPVGKPMCDVITIAKRDLSPGETLDGIGGFTCFGTIENADISRTTGLLPMGLSEGCRLTRAVRRDQAILYSDVEIPRGRVCDALRAEQESHFPMAAAAEVASPLRSR